MSTLLTVVGVFKTVKPSFVALEARRHGAEVSDAEMGIINNTGDWNSPRLPDSDQSETSSVVT